MYIQKEDITDKTLFDCDDIYINQANANIERVALSVGVKSSDIKNPATDMVKRLGICYACSLIALDSVGQDPTVNIEGKRSDDIYYQKYKMYTDEVDKILKTITRADFTGIDAETIGCGSVPLYRT